MMNGIPIRASYFTRFPIIMLVLGTFIFPTEISTVYSFWLSDLDPLIAMGILVGFSHLNTWYHMCGDTVSDDNVGSNHSVIEENLDFVSI